MARSKTDETLVALNMALGATEKGAALDWNERDADADALTRDTRRLRSISAAQCNGDHWAWADTPRAKRRAEAEDARLEKAEQAAGRRINATLAKYGLAATVDGDPRGVVVKLTTRPDGWPWVDWGQDAFIPEKTDGDPRKR